MGNGGGVKIHGALGVMLRRAKLTRLSAWLGFAALAVQTFLPIHLVFDIVEAGSRAGTESAWRVQHNGDVFPALARAHAEQAPAHSHGHDSHCPISLAQLHATAAFTLPVATTPPSPDIAYMAVAASFESYELASSSPASYASRAPPRPAIG